MNQLRDFNTVCYDKVLKQVQAGYQVSMTVTCKNFNLEPSVNEDQVIARLFVHAQFTRNCYHRALSLSLCSSFKV